MRARAYYMDPHGDKFSVAFVCSAYESTTAQAVQALEKEFGFKIYDRRAVSWHVGISED